MVKGIYKILFLLFCFLLLSESLFAQQRLLAAWQKPLTSGLLALQDGEHNRAEKFFSDYLSNQNAPYSSEAYFFQSVSLLHIQGRENQGVLKLRQLLTNNRLRFAQLGGYYWLAWGLYHQAAYSSTIDPLLQQINLAQQQNYADYTYEALYLLALVYQKQGLKEQALQAYAQLRGQVLLFAAQQYGLLLLDEENYGQAYEMFSLYLRQDRYSKGQLASIFLKAESAFQVEKNVEARDAFELFLRLAEPADQLIIFAQARLIQLQARKENNEQNYQDWQDLDINRLFRAIQLAQRPVENDFWNRIYREIDFLHSLKSYDYQRSISLLDQRLNEDISPLNREIITFNKALLLIESVSTEGLNILSRLTNSSFANIAELALFHLGRKQLSSSLQQRQQGVQTLKIFISRYPFSEYRFQCYSLLADFFYQQPGLYLPDMQALTAIIEQDPGLEDEEKIRFYMKTAESFRAQGDLSSALNFYEKTYQTAPKTTIGLTARYRIAYIYAQRNEYARSLLLMQNILQDISSPQLIFETTSFYTNLLLALSRVDEALIYLDTLIDMAQDGQQRQEAYLQKGIAFYRLNRNNEAIALFNGIINHTEQPLSVSFALFWRGATYFRMSAFAQAQQDFITAARNYPFINQADALYRAAFAAEAQSNYNEAVELLKEAVQLFIGDEALYYEAGVRLLKLQLVANQQSAARRTALGYLEQENGQAMINEGFHQAAEFLFNNGKTSESLNVLETRTRYFPGIESTGDSLYLQASLYMQLGNYTKATEFFVSYIQNFPQGSFANSVALIMAQLLRQNYPESHRIIEAALQQFPMTLQDTLKVATLSREEASNRKLFELEQLYRRMLPGLARDELTYELGKTYLELNRIDDGQALLAQLRNSNADAFWKGAAQMELASFLYKRGEIDQAVPLYEEILEDYNPFPELVAEALYRLADIYEWQGDDRSSSYRRRLLDEHRDSSWARRSRFQ